MLFPGQKTLSSLGGVNLKLNSNSAVIQILGENVNLKNVHLMETEAKLQVIFR